MMKALREPLNTKRLTARPTRASTTRLPPTSATRAQGAMLPKKAGAKNTSTAMRPVQGTNGVSSMVSSRVLRSSIMRVPSMAGTLQPKPSKQGHARLAVQPHPVHVAVHHVGGARHVAHVLEQSRAPRRTPPRWA